MIAKIPDFSDPRYMNLVEGLSKGGIIFLGAGVSKLAGYKLWDELAMSLAEIFFREKLISYSMNENLKKHDEPLKVMDYLISINVEQFRDAVTEIFDNDAAVEKKDIYQALAMLAKNNCFIQTNIDKGLQNHLSIKDGDIGINPFLDLPPKRLNYIHGIIDRPDTWVLTTSRYNQIYHKDDGLEKFLINIFKDYTVLFIGYGLQDSELQIMLRKLKNKRHYNLYLLERYFDGIKDKAAVEATNNRENYGIETIHFNIDKEGDVLLIKVIKQLYSVADSTTGINII